MKKFILILIFISLISLQVFAFQGSDNLEIIKKKAALNFVRNNYHNSERIKIHNPFQFDYDKREKTTVRSYPTEPGNRDLMDVKINGEDQATIVQGDDFVVTIYFSDGCSEASVSMWADMNGNGTWEDDIDLLVPDTEDEIVDNDIEDEDPAVGIYQMTFYGDEDGPNRVSNLGLFFVAEDTDGIDAAFLWIDPITSDYSVSGSVSPVYPNIIIAAMSSEENMWMTATDASGNYQSFVPTAEEYMVMAFDPLGVLGGGMFPDTVYVDVNINGHITGYDFNFIPGNANIEGTVLDENDAPVVGVTVYAEGQIPGGVSTETNSSGYYNLTVIEGWWEVGFNWDDLIPDYLPVEEVGVYVEEGGTETVDFLIYETDSTIEGTVYLDDIPAAGFEIDSWSEIGMTETDSEQGGSYVLHVASEADAMGGYSVNVDIWDIPDVYVVESYNNIMSGSTGIDFHIYTVTGGVEGHIYDSVTLEPAENCWVSAFDGTNWFNTGVNDEGYYQLPLPNGTYEISAQGEMYYQQMVPDIVIEDDMIIMNFYLDPISFDGELWGIVFEEGTTDPIGGVQIWAFCDPYCGYTVTNEDGYYHFDLPNGTYVLDAWHVNYYGVHIEDIVINYNIVQQDFEMGPVSFDGSLEGYVYEENTTNPVTYANISVGIPGGYYASTYSDGTGYYYFDLPNGTYSLDCWKDGYLGFHEDNIIINDDNVVFDIYLVPDVDTDDELILPASSLSQNYPNPFNPETTISFTTENTENTEVIIYNLKGQQVRILVNEVFPAGRHSVLWDGGNDKCEPVSSGLYFFKLETGTFSSVKKMILIK